LEQLGHKCLVPDLNVPSFKELTLSAQLNLIERLRPLLADQIVIIGSSMGGLLAAILAAAPDAMKQSTSVTKSPQLSLPGIKAIILMAP
ncbi:YqiA/YcfP family alpha/beta fold hydrolase, partial [Acinetobacter baumannii]